MILFQDTEGDKVRWDYEGGAALSWEGYNWLEVDSSTFTGIDYVAGIASHAQREDFSIQAPLMVLFDPKPSLSEAKERIQASMRGAYTGFSRATRREIHRDHLVFEAERLWDESRSQYIIDKITGLNGHWCFLLSWSLRYPTRASLLALENGPWLRGQDPRIKPHQPPKWVKNVYDHFNVGSLPKTAAIPTLWERLANDD